MQKKMTITHLTSQVTLCTPSQTLAPPSEHTHARTLTHASPHIVHSSTFPQPWLPEQQLAMAKVWVPSSYHFFQTLEDHHNTFHSYNTVLFPSTFKTIRAFLF